MPVLGMAPKFFSGKRSEERNDGDLIADPGSTWAGALDDHELLCVPPLAARCTRLVNNGGPIVHREREMGPQEGASTSWWWSRKVPLQQTRSGLGHGKPTGRLGEFEMTTDSRGRSFGLQETRCGGLHPNLLRLCSLARGSQAVALGADWMPGGAGAAAESAGLKQARALSA